MSCAKAIFLWPTASTAEQLKIRVLVITLKDFVNFGGNRNDVCLCHILAPGELLPWQNGELQSDTSTSRATDGCNNSWVPICIYLLHDWDPFSTWLQSELWLKKKVANAETSTKSQVTQGKGTRCRIDPEFCTDPLMAKTCLRGNV